MKNYTIIPNEILDESDLDIPARYLYCVLLRHCGKDDHCYPGQETLGRELGYTDRQIRNLLNNLLKTGLITKKRTGYNKSNTYHVARTLARERKGGSYQLGSSIPLHTGNQIPPNNTYRKGKGNKGFQKFREQAKRLGISKKM